jgi:LPS export ABC transporter protein LptC
MFSMRLKSSLFILAFFLLCELVGCQREEPPRVEEGDFQNAPEQVIENMEVTFTEQGRRTGVLKADSVAIYQQGKVRKGKKIQVDFFDQDGEHTSTLTAEEGIYDSKAEEIEARGNVVVISDEGVRLETEVLSWRKQTNRIFTEAFVKIIRGRNIVSGYGLDTDPRLEDVHIRRNLQGRIEDVQEIGGQLDH